MWSDERGANLLDGGAPFYDCYRCADGKWVAVGALEPRFFEALKARLGLGAAQGDPQLREELTHAFAAHPRDHWTALFAGSDACVAPVLSMAEAPHHPHLSERGTFAIRDGIVQPRPAPRFLGS
jgi:alpha-methylacyl-CoA racemase